MSELARFRNEMRRVATAMDETEQGRQRGSETLEQIRYERVHHTEPAAWSQARPPCDSAAESALLNMVLMFPAKLGTLDLRDRLYLPEHRTIHQAMARVWMRRGLLDVGNWCLAVMAELHAVTCGQGCQDEPCRGTLLWDVLTRGEQIAHEHDIDYWLNRLDRCVEARSLIEAAQDQASRAWRGDLDGARTTAAKAGQSRTPIRIEID